MVMVLEATDLADAMCQNILTVDYGKMAAQYTRIPLLPSTFRSSWSQTWWRVLLTLKRQLHRFF